MEKSFYSTVPLAVDSVFFAVVPDAFMTRESGGHITPANGASGSTAWPSECERTLLAPHDRWSF